MMSFDNVVSELDKLLGVLMKYELHAAFLVFTGIALILHGLKEEGFAVVSAGLAIFKGKN
jgi:hypothetical protein